MLRSAPALALALLLLTSAAAQELARHEFESPHMGTRFEIILYAPDPESAGRAAAAAFALAEKLDACFSDYEADSELRRLIENGSSTVSPELFDILTIARRISEQTGGAFDITTGNATRQWRKARITGKLAKPDQIESAKTNSGWKKIKLEKETRRVTLPSGMQLDLGGIAKGYAADAMLALLEKRGLPVASVAAGGDIAVGDPPPGRQGWTIALSPDGENQTRSVELANQAVSTSGAAEQQITIAGKSYSHIVDPSTGLGLPQSSPVSVIARRATQTDAYATALSVIGKKRSGAIVKEQKLEVVWGRQE